MYLVKKSPVQVDEAFWFCSFWMIEEEEMRIRSVLLQNEILLLPFAKLLFLLQLEI